MCWALPVVLTFILLIEAMAMWAPLAAALTVICVDVNDADASISVFDAMAAVDGHSEHTYI
jgi:hypothetical protein